MNYDDDDDDDEAKQSSLKAFNGSVLTEVVANFVDAQPLQNHYKRSILLALAR